MSEQIEDTYWKNLAASFPTDKLEFLEIVLWILTNEASGRAKFYNAIRDEILLRKGLLKNDRNVTTS